MLIINADDWGHSAAATDAALRCHQAGRITSVSAMVFMADSERAAKLAKDHQLDVGLHLNFSEPFRTNNLGQLNQHHARTVRFLRGNKYSQLFYNPWLGNAFNYSYHAQVAEFVRLFGMQPSHIDGHHHMHLCANLTFGRLIPSGTKVRRNFSFWPGEKSWLNRAYRAAIDRWIGRRYRLTDYFFDLTQSLEEGKLERVVALSKSNKVELMTHPAVATESTYLLSDQFGALLDQIEVGRYVDL